jgi:hypothetical protein
MIVVHGTYFLARKVLAFRNDYCLRCAAPRLAVRQRTFDVAHVFWIPILPLGFWKRWLCSSCGNDPHTQVRTSRGVKWVGVVLLVFFAVIAWTGPASGKDPSDTIGIWLMRIGLPIGLAFAVRGTLRSPEPERLRDKLREVTPYGAQECPLCRAQLVHRARGWQCIGCGAERQDVKAA